MPSGQENSVEHPDGQQSQEGIRHLGPQGDDDRDEERAEDEEGVDRSALTDDVEIVEDDAWCASRARPMRAISGSPSRRADRPGRSAWSAGLGSWRLSRAGNEIMP